MHGLEIESTILIQSCFFAPLLFLAVYSLRAPWWATVHGRTLSSLALVFVVVLLRPVLIYWHVLPAHEAEQQDWGTWAATSALALAPLAFGMMTWQLLRLPLHRLRKRLRNPKSPDPLNDDAPERLNCREKKY